MDREAIGYSCRPEQVTFRNQSSLIHEIRSSIRSWKTPGDKGRLEPHVAGCIWKLERSQKASLRKKRGARSKACVAAVSSTVLAFEC